MKLNRRLFCSLATFLCLSAAQVSAQTLMWAKNIGGSAADYGRSTSFDAAGNVYTVGDFRNTADFDPGPGDYPLTASGSTNSDIFISKLDKNGNFIWARSIGGTNPDMGYAAMAAPNGDVYVTGSYNAGTAGSQLDFNPDPAATSMLTGYGGTDIFVCKFKANGDFAWAVGYGGSSGDLGQGIVIDDQENVYVTGTINGIVNFNPGGTAVNIGTSGVATGFVLKLNSSGAFQWAGGIGGVGRSIKIDKRGDLVITGSFSGTVDFNPGPATESLTTNGGNDIYVLKLTSSGDFRWVKRMGGTGADIGMSVGIDRDNNIITTGTFSSTVDFDPGPLTNNLISAGGTDVFIAKFDSLGNYIWAKKVGGSVSETVNGVTIDNDDKIYIGGRFEGTVDFDPGTGTHNLSSQAIGGWTLPDAYILKLNQNGDFEFAFSVGGADGADNMNSINIDPEYNFYITGDFIDTGNFAVPPGWTTLKSNGSNDVFIAKYAQPSCKTYSTLNLSTGCPSITVNGETYTANGTYEQRLRNAVNCDSVITLNIALNNSLPTTINHTACNSYVFNGKTYTTSGTYKDTFKNALNCDSVVVLNLTINRSYNTQVSHAACGSYSYNGTTYVVGGSYTHHFTTVNGCDSTVVLNLTINNNSTPTQRTVSSCYSYTFGGTTYYNSGSYTHTFKNIYNCDSVSTVHLTIHQPSSTQVNHAACESYTYDGTTYVNSGTYTHYFSNVNNCDSVVTLNLTIKKNASSSLRAIACDNYVLNGQTYTSSGTYTQTLQASNGCDSIITLDLTINSKPDAVITPAGETLTASSGDSYQWLDCNNGYAAIPSATGRTLVTEGAGRYAVVVTTNGCSDTSECFEVFPAGISHTEGGAFAIYPNPAREYVIIRSAGTLSNAAIRLISTTGQHILVNPHYNGSSAIVSLNGLASGVYLLEIVEGEKVYRKTLLKE